MSPNEVHKIVTELETHACVYGVCVCVCGRVCVCVCTYVNFSVISEQSRSLQPLSSVYFEEDTGEMKILKIYVLNIVFSVSGLTVHIKRHIIQQIIDCSTHSQHMQGVAKFRQRQMLDVQCVCVCVCVCTSNVCICDTQSFFGLCVVEVTSLQIDGVLAHARTYTTHTPHTGRQCHKETAR